MSNDCNNCARGADPLDTVYCQPCAFFTDGRPPTNWVAIQILSEPDYTDTQRLEWMLPLMSVVDDPTGLGEKRTAALAAALMLGKNGRDAIDFAMEGSP